jgi:alpha-amylase
MARYILKIIHNLMKKSDATIKTEPPSIPPCRGGGFQKSVCFYFQVHQPYRLRDISFFEDTPEDIFLGPQHCTNKQVFEKVADKCYLPATKMFLHLCKTYPFFRVAFSLSGVFIEQCEEFGQKGREVLELFQELAKTGQCEFLAETYSHSLSFLYSKQEYAEQIVVHSKKIKELFGQTPKIFRNTELIYRDDIGEFIRQMGFEGMICEGWDHYLHSSNPHTVRHAVPSQIHAEETKIAHEHGASKKIVEPLPLLLKSYQLSDDVAFRFGNKDWKEYPVTTKKYADWLENVYGDTINLFMDYETIGEHQWEDTGIFQFFEHLPLELQKRNIGFKTPSETIKQLPMGAEYAVSDFLSWADSERNLSAWVENDLQYSALEELSFLESALHQYKTSPNKKQKHLLDLFAKIQTSDHLYYMCTKYWSDGDVHKYFSPYDSPYEAYISFMNAARYMRAEIEKLEEK